MFGHRGSRSRRLRVAISALGAVTAILLAAVMPATAKVIERGTYSGEYSFSYDDCGFWVDVEGVFGGTAHIRVGTGSDATAFFGHDNFWYQEVATRRGTTDGFTITGSGLFQETRATRVDGSVFTFSSIEAGQPFVLVDDEGTLQIRDRGVIRRTILFDTQGDDVPGGEWLADLDLGVAGPHPAFFDFFPCPYFG